MFNSLALLTIVVHCSYASYYGSGGGYGGSGANIVSGGGHTIPAAIKSTWRLDVRPVHLPQEQIQPQVIEIPAIELPVKLIYNSKSSGVFVQQIHTPGSPGQTEATKSEEEPHILSHEVVRPVIQELREVIVPYRRIVQEIQPVVEDIQTVVARGEGRQNNAAGGGGGVISSVVAGGAGGGLGGSNGGGNMGGLFGGDNVISAGSILLGLGNYGDNDSGKDSLGGSGLGGYGAKAASAASKAAGAAGAAAASAGKKA